MFFVEWCTCMLVVNLGIGIIIIIIIIIIMFCLFFFCLFLVIKPENLYFASRFRLEVNPPLEYIHSGHLSLPFFGFRRPNQITGLSGWRAPD